MAITVAIGRIGVTVLRIGNEASRLIDGMAPQTRRKPPYFVLLSSFRR